jgi:diguanylate cyclase (GGDEF)-like protein
MAAGLMDPERNSEAEAAAKGFATSSLAPAEPVVDTARLGRLIERVCETPAGDALGITLGELADLLGAQHGVAVLIESGTRVRAATEVSLLETVLDLDRYTAVTEAMKRHEIVIFAWDGGDAAAAPHAAGGLAAGWAMALPLEVGAHLLGTLVLRSIETPRPDPNRLATAAVLAQVGAGLFLHGLRAAGRGRLAAVNAASTASAGGRRRLLLVEDDDDIAIELQDALELEGYDVVAERSGETGLLSALRHPPDLVVLDVRLPDRDGFSVARELAEDQRTAGVPILFLSAAEDLSTRVRHLHNEEMDFLAKPFLLKDLVTRIQQSLLRADTRRRLVQTAHLDELTGLGNLRLFEERLATEAARTDRYHTPLTIVVMDLDKLKAINDAHGHSVGSAVLRAVGETLKHAIRETDLAARYGGDEFVVLLPHTDLVHGTAFAERFLNGIRNLRPNGLAITMSVGVACFDARVDDSAKHLFERADQASYRAKREGGDRVRIDEPRLNTIITPA